MEPENAPQLDSTPPPQPPAEDSVMVAQQEPTPPAQHASVLPEQQQPMPATEPQPTPEPVEKKEGGIFSFIGTLVIAFLLVQFINLFLFQSYKVFGNSMHPTLDDGDRLIISKIGRSTAKLFRDTYEPERGEVVVFDDPHGSEMQLIKRIIGLPGERVTVTNGVITVYNKEHPNGFNPDEAEYGARLPKGTGNIDVVVPRGHFFVSGDNREGNNSLDSRNELGTVPEDLLIGTLKVRIFPFDRASFF